SYLVTRAGSGGVGIGESAPLVLDSNSAGVVNGKVNVIAGGSVYIKEKAGDVYIEVTNGNLLDANLVQTRDERTYEELKGGVWSDLSLTRDLGAQTKIDNARITFRSLKESEYQSYWNYRNQQPDPSVYDASFVV